MRKYRTIFVIFVCFIFLTGFSVQEKVNSFINNSNVSNITGTSNSSFSSAYPSSYDSRNYIDTFNDDENQQTLNVCWAFTSNNVLEAYLKKNANVSYNFSENQPGYVAKYIGDISSVGGSNSPYNLLKYWTYGLVPVTETVFGTYFTNEASKSFNSYMNVSNIDVREAKVINAFRTSYLLTNYSESSIYYEMDNYNEQIKKYIYDNGAVFSIIHAKFIKKETGQEYGWCYNDGSLEESEYIDTAHAVTLIGWDDNYVYTGSNPAPYRGAWLAYNSWGSSSKYFYISYYDLSVVKSLFGVSNVDANPSWNKSYIVTRSAGAKSYSNDLLIDYAVKTDGSNLYETNRFYIGDDNENLDSVKFFYLGFTEGSTPSNLRFRITVTSGNNSSYAIVTPVVGINTVSNFNNSLILGGNVQVKVEILNSSSLDINDLIYTMVLRTTNNVPTKKIFIGDRGNRFINQLTNVLGFDVVTKNIDAIKGNAYTLTVFDEANNNITSSFSVYKSDIISNTGIIRLTQTQSLDISKLTLSLNIDGVNYNKSYDFGTNSGGGGGENPFTDPIYSFDSSLSVNELDSVISVSPGFTAGSLKSKVNNGISKVYNINNDEVADDAILGTNYKLVIANNGNNYTYGVAVSGDVTGDGLVKINDVMKIATHSIRGSELNTKVLLTAGDVTKDGNIKINDVMKVATYSIKGTGL